MNVTDGQTGERTDGLAWHHRAMRSISR